MICTKCGREVPQGQNFCPVCGAALGAQQTQGQPYQNQGQGYQAQYQKPAQRSSPASIILGIVGIVFVLLYFFLRLIYPLIMRLGVFPSLLPIKLLCHIIFIIGIVLGAIQCRKTGKAGGLILNIIGEVMFILYNLISFIIPIVVYSIF